jgi:hypothetical protein
MHPCTCVWTSECMYVCMYVCMLAYTGDCMPLCLERWMQASIYANSGSGPPRRDRDDWVTGNQMMELWRGQLQAIKAEIVHVSHPHHHLKHPDTSLFYHGILGFISHNTLWQQTNVKAKSWNISNLAVTIFNSITVHVQNSRNRVINKDRYKQRNGQGSSSNLDSITDRVAIETLYAWPIIRWGSRNI